MNILRVALIAFSVSLGACGGGGGDGDSGSNSAGGGAGNGSGNSGGSSGLAVSDEVTVLENIQRTNLVSSAIRSKDNETVKKYSGRVKRWDIDGSLIPVKTNGVAFSEEALSFIENKFGYLLFDRDSISSLDDSSINYGLIFKSGTALGPGSEPHASYCGHVGSKDGGSAFDSETVSAEGKVQQALSVNIGTSHPSPQCSVNQDLVVHEVMHALGLFEHFNGFGQGSEIISDHAFNVLATLYDNNILTQTNELLLKFPFDAAPYNPGDLDSATILDRLNRFNSWEYMRTPADDFFSKTSGLTVRWDTQSLIPVQVNNVQFADQALDTVEAKLGYRIFDRTTIADASLQSIDKGIVFQSGTALSDNDEIDSNVCGHVGAKDGTHNFGTDTVNPDTGYIQKALTVNIGNSAPTSNCTITKEYVVHELLHSMGLTTHWIGFGISERVDYENDTIFSVLKTLYGNPVLTKFNSVKVIY